MAIQVRRGSAADFDGTKLLPGELAVCLDTNELYYKGTEAVKVATATEAKVLIINVPSFSSLPQIVTDSRITADMVLIGWDVIKSVMLSGWDVTPANGSVTITGSISGTTALTLYLLPSR